MAAMSRGVDTVTEVNEVNQGHRLVRDDQHHVPLRAEARHLVPAVSRSGRPGSLLTLAPPQIRTCGFCRIRLLDRWLRYAPSRTRWSRKPGDGHRHPQGLSGQFGYPLS